MGALGSLENVLKGLMRHTQIPQQEGTMKPDIEIQNEADWAQLREKGINIIVDPMIVRSADLLLQGRSGPRGQEPREVWTALSQNVDSIEAFFDAFVLSERLPLVDYGITYDSNIGFEPQSLYRRINEAAGDRILVNVQVMGDASKAASKAARETLQNRVDIDDEQLATAVVHELSAYDHRWEPDLGNLGPLSQEQTLLARFHYGLLLFGHFATRADTGHLVQAKRARLFAAGSLGARTPSYEFDKELRQRLKKVVESEQQRLGVMLNLEACPSFLPHLLSKKPGNTRELLEEALKLRQSDVLSDYRTWRASIISDWQDHGKIAAETERELRRAVRRVLDQLGIDTQQSNFTMGVNFLFLYGEAAVEKLIGWIPPLKEGRRHSKLLMRSIKEAYDYKKLNHALKKIWSET
jgi:hypothetical protein